MTAKEQINWQQSTGALAFLGILGLLAMAWCWAMSWPLAVAGHAGATENLLTSFGGSAFLIAFLSAGFGRRKVLFVGGALWALAFYLSSLILDDIVQGHNVGTVIRVGAVSVMSFVIAAAYLSRKTR